ncbi:Rv2175c family DNA-binding protein [Microbacterium elymi]|uniref:Rv2175c family DNA-binding protein n=1 Tax=Microbacterium elymi TaxID=2909587 RepID=A0ABY5NJ66_9MICO|nr:MULTISPECIES: Rv2175c family DNA-binding protein [Microbacterium]UUT35196.1 Rv2175c family DNA-binding protein [Microbacterium elymi]
MTGENAASAPIEWLTLPELAEAVGETVGRVRRMLDDRQFAAVRRDGVLRVPAAFVVEGRPLSSLRGTLFVLHDAGFTDDEAIDWLFAPEETIGVPPIDALRQGRKSEVRRVAATLA